MRFLPFPPSVYRASRTLQHQYALLLTIQGDYREAVAHLEKLLGHVELDTGRLLYNIGTCYNLQQKTTEALGFYEKAFTAGYRAASLYKDWAGIFQQTGNIEAAEKKYAEAINLFPNDEKILYEYGNFLLKTERYAEGFALYEHRWKILKIQPVDLAIPRWIGESRVDSLLVIKEQGIGDQILYSSLLPALQQKAGQVTAAFNIRLVPLLQRTLPGVSVLTGDLSAGEVAKRFDAYMTCADMVRLAPESIGWQLGYLRPDQDRLSRLREKYQQMFPGKTLIGVSWRSTRATYGEMKSVDILNWAPILTQRSCQFVSLQYGEVRAELQQVREQLDVEIYLDPDIDSFADLDGLAAQVNALDLVVTTSNSTAHIAAGTHAPPWIMIPAGQSLLWYWGYRAQNTRWYPEARLFRAAQPDDWQPVIESVAQALRARLG